MSAKLRLEVIDNHGEPEVWLGSSLIAVMADKRACLMQAKAELEHALERVNAHLQRIDSPKGLARGQWEGDPATDAPGGAA